MEYPPPFLDQLGASMAFKETPTQFRMVDITLVDPDPGHSRKHFDENALKALANSIQKKGLIHPVIIQPANAAGRHTLIVGERRWRAAVIAGETTIPALIRTCNTDEAQEIRVFENLGLGMRTALEPREMANAIQAIVQRFETQEAAAEHFGRTPNWLNQATAAANLSPKIAALLDAGKVSSTGTAVQLERLTKKNETKAELIINQAEQLPEGEKLAKKVVDHALYQEGGRRKKNADSDQEATPITILANTSSGLPPWEELPATPLARPISSNRRLNPGKVKIVADILGLSDGDEEAVLAMLIDEFLAMKGEGKSAS
jgi:ParB family transcriptional regulator, chromosome partitioning protein